MHTKSAILALILTLSWASPAAAYTYQSAVGDGCHERIATDAIRRLRAIDHVPVVTPSDDDRALIHDVPFDLPPDVRDVTGASFAIGVRDNDLHGRGPDELDSIAQLHGDPSLQHGQVELDAELNGWYGTVTKRFDVAAFNAYGTVDFRTPLRFAFFSLRSTANVGTSTLLIDLYGAPSGSTGLFFAFAPLGLEWKLSSRVFPRHGRALDRAADSPVERSAVCVFAISPDDRRRDRALIFAPSSTAASAEGLRGR